MKLQNSVTISELPIGVSTAKYLEKLTKPGRGGKANPRDAYIESISDRSSAEKVVLQVVLRDGAFESILENFGDAEIDPIEDGERIRPIRLRRNRLAPPRGGSASRRVSVSSSIWAKAKSQLKEGNYSQGRLRGRPSPPHPELNPCEQRCTAS